MDKEKQYIKTEFIGKGAYGTVWKGKNEEGNEIYALKIIKIKDTSEEGIQPSTIKEICMSKELNHINIVKLIDVVHSSEEIVMVFELLDKDLRHVIESSNGGLEPHIVKSYMYQFLKGLSYIHRNKILHRDLKPANILIKNNEILKIGDFGLARGYGLPISEFFDGVATLWYRAPDLLMGNNFYSTDVDMWSVGCIFLEMVNGNQIFNCKEPNLQLNKIFQIIGTPNLKTYPKLEELPKWERINSTMAKYPGEDLKKYVSKLDDEGLDLLKKFLQVDPSKRISADDALKHPYFKDIDEKTLNLYINENEEDE